MLSVNIVGGGVIGLLSALRLAQCGCQVRVFEQGQLGAQSSWAGGGILYPLYPWRYDSALQPLLQYSLSLYPQLMAELATTGTDPEYQRSGLLVANLTPSEQQQARDWLASHKIASTAWDATRLQQAVPESQLAAPAYHLPQVAQVRNPRLLQALIRYVRQQPQIQLYTQTPVEQLCLASQVCHGLQAKGQTFSADHTVIAAGAWSGRWCLPAEEASAIRPIRGQMLLFKAPPGWLSTILLANDCYLIPRKDGHILCGSTLEDAGFDTVPTPQAGRFLYRQAINILPGLAQWPLLAQWAGLRPGSGGNQPYIGPVPGINGLWINSGHYRYGLTLAPGSSRLLADLLLQQVPAIDPAPYAVETGRPQISL